MRGFLYLADVVHPSPDGTVSLIRGGLGRLMSPAGSPALMNLMALVRVEEDGLTKGKHRLTVDIVNEHNERIQPGELPAPVRGQVELMPLPYTIEADVLELRPIQAFLQILIPLPARGRYFIVLTFDDTELYRTTIASLDVSEDELARMGVRRVHAPPS